ncbi:hypothetical protein [Prochlorococcus marinus]|uniref:hypothetical protein n=1 Tax=Prochlorococcus TaxID=1218 RepID=UPI0018C872FA|nr:hypothetical protein [Prochlorococcus marinus]
MSFISLMMLERQDSAPRVEQELFYWRIRIDSEAELDVELKQGAEEEPDPDHRRSFLIPNGSTVITLIVDDGEIIKKIYQSPNGEKISVNC